MFCSKKRRANQISPVSSSISGGCPSIRRCLSCLDCPLIQSHCQITLVYDFTELKYVYYVKVFYCMYIYRYVDKCYASS